MLDYIIDAPNTYRLLLNGKELQRSQGHVIAYEDSIRVTVSDKSLYKDLIRLPFMKLSGKFQSLRLAYPYTLHTDFREWLIDSVSFDFKSSYPLIEVGFIFEFNPMNWHYLWSMADHFATFSEALSIESVSEYSWNHGADEAKLMNLELTVFVEFDHGIFSQAMYLKEIIEPILEDIEKTNSDTIIKLSTRANAHSLTIPFTFPDEVKVACQQYLVYFAQFLHDMGIDATAETTERSGQMLFSVTPKDKDEALDVIRDVLDIYLRFPTAPVANGMQDIFTTDIVVQRLEANIQHLRGQLLLAHATLQAQLATIQAKEARLQYLELSQLLTSGQVVIDSQVKHETSPADDREPIIEGILDVKRFDLGGLGELNLPEMVRRIKAFVARRKGGDNNAT